MPTDDPLTVPAQTPDEASAPPPLPGMTRAQWVAILCGVAAFVAMAVVLVIAGEAPPEPTRPEAPAFAPGAGDPPEPGGESLPGRVLPPGAMSECGPLDPERPPELEFQIEGDEVDFGKLKQGVRVTRDVIFKNVGQGPLCVAKVQTGCGCLKATLVGDQKRYEPGESGTIKLQADTTGRVGIVRKTVKLFTNDIKVPQRSFRAVLDVAAGLLAEPRYLQFGNVAPDTAVTRTMFLRSGKDDTDWTVTKVESMRRIAGRDPVAYTFDLSTVPDERYHKVRLRVTHPGYAETGAVRDVLAITTTHAERKVVEVPAHIHVVPRIRCRSRSISMGFVQAGAARLPTRVRIEAGAPTVVFSIERVEVTAPGGAAAGPGGAGFEATFGKDGRGWWVDVRYDGRSRGEGLLEAELRVHTDDELQPLVIVPIRATVRSPR